MAVTHRGLSPPQYQNTQRREDVIRILVAHFDGYVGKVCRCGAPLYDVHEWARHVAIELFGVDTPPTP